MLCLAVGGMISGWMPGPGRETLRFLVNAVCFHGAVLLMVQLLLWEHRTGWREAFGLGSRGWVGVAGLGALAALVVLPVAWGLSWVAAEVMRMFFVEPAPQQAVMTLQTSKAAWEQCLMGLVAVAVAPWAEEVLFRGLFYPVLKQRVRPWVAVGATSVLFAVIHLNAMTFVPLLVFSLVLTWLYDSTENLLAPVTAHAVFNLVNLLMLLR
jgi:uncharacterized protein